MYSPTLMVKVTASSEALETIRQGTPKTRSQRRSLLPRIAVSGQGIPQAPRHKSSATLFLRTGNNTRRSIFCNCRHHTTQRHKRRDDVTRWRFPRRLLPHFLTFSAAPFTVLLFFSSFFREGVKWQGRGGAGGQKGEGESPSSTVADGPKICEQVTMPNLSPWVEVKSQFKVKSGVNQSIFSWWCPFLLFSNKAFLSRPNRTGQSWNTILRSLIGCQSIPGVWWCNLKFWDFSSNFLGDDLSIALGVIPFKKSWDSLADLPFWS